jgi:membrane protease YdiL (CAAX protease family)
LVISVAVMFLTTVLLVVAALAIRFHGGPLPDRASIAHVQQQLFAPSLLLSNLTGMAVVVWLSLRWGADRLRDPSATGFAWVRAPLPAVLLGAASGALLAITFLLVSPRLFPLPRHAPVAPLVRLVGTPGVPRLVGLLSMLLLVPVFEEYLFRGVLLGGCIAGGGTVVASAAVTLLFVLVHLPGILHDWPAAVALGALGLLLAVLRLRHRSLAPCVVAHLCYNLVLAVPVLLARYVCAHP